MQRRLREPVHIGVDGGGTGTSGVMVDGHGRLLAQARVGPLNVQRTRPATLEGRLRLLTRELFGRARATPRKAAVIYLGLAGAGRDTDALPVQEQVERLGLAEQVVVTSDGRIALEGAFAGGPGVMVSAGTGSVAFGKDPQGRVARSGGWGYLLGDEGSAFDIARRALAASLEAFDGRGPATLLGARINARLGLTQIDDVIPRVYRGRVHPEAVAGLADLVFRAAQEGDQVASGIILAAGRGLGALALSVCRRLDMSGPACLCLVGGLSVRSADLLPAMKAVLREVSPLTVQQPCLTPVQGAALCALRMSGAKPDPAALMRLWAPLEGRR